MNCEAQYTLHTADADATQLSRRSRAACIEFATSSRLPTNLVEKLKKKLKTEHVESSWVVSGGVYSPIGCRDLFQFCSQLDCRLIKYCQHVRFSIFRRWTSLLRIQCTPPTRQLNSCVASAVSIGHYSFFIRQPVRSNGRTYKMLVMFFFFFFNA